MLINAFPIFLTINYNACNQGESNLTYKSRKKTKCQEWKKWTNDSQQMANRQYDGVTQRTNSAGIIRCRTVICKLNKIAVHYRDRVVNAFYLVWIYLDRNQHISYSGTKLFVQVPLRKYQRGFWRTLRRRIIMTPCFSNVHGNFGGLHWAHQQWVNEKQLRMSSVHVFSLVLTQQIFWASWFFFVKSFVVWCSFASHNLKTWDHITGSPPLKFNTTSCKIFWFMVRSCFVTQTQR